MKCAADNSSLCRSHGGGKRCSTENCNRPVRGGQQQCTVHQPAKTKKEPALPTIKYEVNNTGSVPVVPMPTAAANYSQLKSQVAGMPAQMTNTTYGVGNTFTKPTDAAPSLKQEFQFQAPVQTATTTISGAKK